MNNTQRISELLGKTIVSVDGIQGPVVAFDERANAFVIMPTNRLGWTGTPQLRNIVLSHGVVSADADTTNRFWYVTGRRIVGVLTPVDEFFKAAETVPNGTPSAPPELPEVPVEPTAPMAVQVLQMLRKKGDVTSIEAQGVLRCRSLSKRISELKRLGHQISRTLHEDHTGQRYARYSLNT